MPVLSLPSAALGLALQPCFMPWRDLAWAVRKGLGTPGMCAMSPASPGVTTVLPKLASGNLHLQPCSQRPEDICCGLAGEQQCVTKTTPSLSTPKPAATQHLSRGPQLHTSQVPTAPPSPAPSFFTAAGSLQRGKTEAASWGPAFQPCCGAGGSLRWIWQQVFNLSSVRLKQREPASHGPAGCAVPHTTCISTQGWAEVSLGRSLAPSSALSEVG